MNTLALCTLLAVWGVDAGYEPTADGHLEYIIQISPGQLDSLAHGQDLTCEVPAKLDIRHYRVTVGTARLPHLTAKPVAGESATFETTSEGALPPEAAGEAHPKIHVGYHEPQRGTREWVVEIEPEALEELHHGDIAGDLPASVSVTCFRVTSKTGSAPVDSQHGENSHSEVTTPAVETLSTTTETPPPAEIEYTDESAEAGSSTAEMWEPPAGNPLATETESSQAEPKYADGWSTKELSGEPSSPSDEEEQAPHTLPENKDPFFNNPEKEKAPAHLKASYAEGDHGSSGSKKTKGDKLSDEGPSEGELKSPGKKKTDEEGTPKQGLPLSIALILLFISLGGNVYLGYLILDTRLRCRRLLQKMNGLDDEEELVAHETHGS